MSNQSSGYTRRRRGTSRSSGQREQVRFSVRERVRLAQLAVCFVLFCVVFVGKGAFPQEAAELQGRLQTILTADTDFRTAFSELGESLAEEKSVFGDLGEFCIQVFGGSGKAEEVFSAQEQIAEEQTFLNHRTAVSEQAAHYLRMDQVPEEWFKPKGTDPEQTETAAPTSEETVPTVGTVLLKSDYSGTPLPENYTMDQLSLGGLQTVNPILGHLRSEYGYRDHPVDGTYKFHNGVDIGGQIGEAIGAFAAGTVDYIGENDTHGLYLQIDHGNGIKSFYAHCSKLCVSQGQIVAAGEKVAEVGATGVSTGPHLHLELKYNGLHLNPAYYVSFLND